MEIVNGNYTESQAPEVLSSSQLVLSDQQILDIMSPFLYSLNQKDLLILEYILKNRDVRVEDLMPYMDVSNPSISVRLKKMRESNIEGTEYALLTTKRDGNAFIYSFTNKIEHKQALAILQSIMSKRGVSYAKYAKKKGIFDAQNSNFDEFQEELEAIQIDKTEDCCCQENEQFQCSTEEVDEEIESCSEDWIDENQAVGEIDFDELSTRLVTMGEVLEMLDEASNTLIENITEGITEIFNEKITELNNRIVELEKKLSSSQTDKNTQESTEELLNRARLLVRQKIFAKKGK